MCGCVLCVCVLCVWCVVCVVVCNVVCVRYTCTRHKCLTIWILTFLNLSKITNDQCGAERWNKQDSPPKQESNETQPSSSKQEWHDDVWHIMLHVCVWLADHNTTRQQHTALWTISHAEHSTILFHHRIEDNPVTFSLRIQRDNNCKHKHPPTVQVQRWIE